MQLEELLDELTIGADEAGGGEADGGEASAGSSSGAGGATQPAPTVSFAPEDAVVPPVEQFVLPEGNENVKFIF